MQRMELHLSGVAVPPLGSPKDRVIRDYLSKRALKEVYKHKVLALSALVSAKGMDSMGDQILKAFDNYSNMEMYLDRVREEIESTMKEEYEFWKKSRPKVNISKDGKLGLSVSSLKPKS